MAETKESLEEMLSTVEERLDDDAALEEAEVLDLLTRAAWVVERAGRRRDLATLIARAEELIIKVRERASKEGHVPPHRVGALEVKARTQAKRLANQGERPPVPEPPKK